MILYLTTYIHCLLHTDAARSAKSAKSPPRIDINDMSSFKIPRRKAAGTATTATPTSLMDTDNINSNIAIALLANNDENLYNIMKSEMDGYNPDPSDSMETKIKGVQHQLRRVTNPHSRKLIEQLQHRSEHMKPHSTTIFMATRCGTTTENLAGEGEKRSNGSVGPTVNVALALCRVFAAQGLNLLDLDGDQYNCFSDDIIFVNSCDDCPMKLKSFDEPWECEWWEIYAIYSIAPVFVIWAKFAKACGSDTVLLSGAGECNAEGIFSIAQEYAEHFSGIVGEEYSPH